MRAFESLLEPLISYTCDVFKNVTPDKLADIRLLYEIIREAAADLHGTNEEYKLDAKAYFKSDLFKIHCENVGIDDDTMLYIVNNPHKYLKKFGVYGEEQFYEMNHESNF